MREVEHPNTDGGYDAQSGEFGDLIAKGIVDPTKDARCALQDAASIAGLLITTEAMVVEKPKKQPAARSPALEWTIEAKPGSGE